MDINFDDLKKDFDALKAVKEIKEEQCEIACESEAEAEGFIESIQKNMLAPVKCGVYFSRLDIKVIGLRMGEDVMVRERKRMLRDILRSITGKESFQAFIDAVDMTAQEKISVYEKLQEIFLRSCEFFEPNIKKYEKFKKLLNAIKEDIEEAEQE
ncbi:hypothetical protein [Nitratiruptor sp. YY09-18]|uniref:hypothetical protein n=1 Tax=Nitratiruptor sp. YY09-18 TaxID=2724901 RepID=UPI00191605F6|nr:hypothetical protein [Nitratiruptor sp. YY09-18]BCD68420.1 hypothetical protein NitYY0918_C1335 [Nitratiruptor sp. YY09-18]